MDPDFLYVHCEEFRSPVLKYEYTYSSISKGLPNFWFAFMQTELDRRIKGGIEKLPVEEPPLSWRLRLSNGGKGLSHFRLWQPDDVTWTHCDELVDEWMDRWDAGDKSFEGQGMASGSGSG
jgi:hypothetical protein